jgi:ankyrin repeat protein
MLNGNSNNNANSSDDEEDDEMVYAFVDRFKGHYDYRLSVDGRLSLDGSSNANGNTNHSNTTTSSSSSGSNGHKNGHSHHKYRFEGDESPSPLKPQSQNGSSDNMKFITNDKDKYSTDEEVDEEGNKLDEFPLHTAVIANDAQQVQLLLDSLPSLSRSVDEQARTALHMACKLGRVNIAELILRTSTNVNAQDFHGRTCLHYCSHSELATMLLDAGCNPNVQDDQGYTPLHVSTMSCNLMCIKVLLTYGADPTICDTARRRSVIHVAVDTGNPELLACILFESRHLIQLNSPDIDGNSAIHLAAQSTNRAGQQQNMITLLLDRGGSALVLNNRLISALHFVCANRFLCESSLAEPLVEILLDQDASPNAQDMDGCTPLTIAAAHREWGLCRLLLESGGDLNIPCPMSCEMLSQCVSINSPTARTANDSLLKKTECTASDLLPRKARTMLFPYICVMQTFIPPDQRDHCMNCGEIFGGSGTSSSGIGVTSSSSTISNGNGSSSTSSMYSSFSSLLLSPSTTAATGMGIPKSNSGRSLSTATTSTNSSSNDLNSLNKKPTPSSSMPSFMSNLFQTLRLSSGKHHCRICNRVVCQECSSTYLDFDNMPEFFQENCKKIETTFRVCKVCFGIQAARRFSSVPS